LTTGTLLFIKVRPYLALSFIKHLVEVVNLLEQMFQRPGVEAD
jgi:hypothetical protein